MTIEAWHFVGNTLRDGRPIPPDGKWLVHRGPVKICKSGLHASRRPWHALPHAPGTVLCRVECDHVVDEQNYKLVCRRRRIIERANVTKTLQYFARMQALSIIHLYNNPPDVVLDYLMTGDKAIRTAAWTAAQTAARDAAWFAARIAAQAAAWAATDTDIQVAAWAAARVAAHDAARNAAWVDARPTAQIAVFRTIGIEFDTLIFEQFGVKDGQECA